MRLMETVCGLPLMRGRLETWLETCPTSSAEFLDIRDEHERHFYEQHEKRIYSSGARASAFGKMNPRIAGYQEQRVRANRPLYRRESGHCRPCHFCRAWAVVRRRLAGETA